MDYDDDFNDDFESQFADHEEMLRELEAEKNGDSSTASIPGSTKPKEKPENVYDTAVKISADLNTSNEADLRKKRRFEKTYESFELEDLSLNEEVDFVELERSNTWINDIIMLVKEFE